MKTETMIVTPIIERFIAEDNACLHSGSAFELGTNAAQITWENSTETASLITPLSEDQVGELKEYWRSTGGWDDDEIDGWDETTLAALVVQECASEYRRLTEHEGLDLAECTQDDISTASQNEGGRLWLCDGREWELYLGV